MASSFFRRLATLGAVLAATVLAAGCAEFLTPEERKADLTATLMANPDILTSVLRQHPQILNTALRENSVSVVEAVRLGETRQAAEALRQERIKQVKDPLQPVVEANRPGRGASAAVGSPVTVAAYLDFSSPDSGQAAQVLQQLAEKHPDDVRVVLKHAPQAGNRYAQAAAVYFEAIAKTEPSLAWKYFDLLFYNQQNFIEQGEKEARRVARAAGADLNRLDQRMRAGADLQDRVTKDTAEFGSFGFTRTPSFVVGGVAMSGPATLADFEEVLGLIAEHRPAGVSDARASARGQAVDAEKDLDR